MEATVIIPAYNEEAAIRETVVNVLKVVRDCGLDAYQVIVVDDGSDDATSQLAREAGAEVIRHPSNAGYGRALKTGMAEARHDTIVIIDADLTYPAEAIGDLLSEFAGGFDMVVGARGGKHYQESILKWPMRLLLRSIVEWATGAKIPDINSGVRAFSRNKAQAHLNQLSDKFSFTTSLTLAFLMTGKFVKHVPVAYDKRLGKSKISLWKDSWRTLKFILLAILYYDPMKIFFLMMWFCLGIAAVSVAIGVTFEIATGFVMGVGSLIMAIVVLCLGLLAALLKQILEKSD